MSQHDQDQFELDIRAVKRAEADLCISKNADYGPFNIARAPGGPINGLAVRLHDKVARLAHLLETGADPQHESVKDTFQDIANYGSIGTMVLEGLWPGVDEASGGATPPALSLGDRVRVTNAKLGAYHGVEGKIVDLGSGSWDWKVELPGYGEVQFDTFELERL